MPDTVLKLLAELLKLLISNAQVLTDLAIGYRTPAANCLSNYPASFTILQFTGIDRRLCVFQCLDKFAWGLLTQRGSECRARECHCEHLKDDFVLVVRRANFDDLVVIPTLEIVIAIQ